MTATTGLGVKKTLHFKLECIKTKRHFLAETLQAGKKEDFFEDFMN